MGSPSASSPSPAGKRIRDSGRYPINQKPKDIQEGTINHVAMALNAMQDAGQEGEAKYLLIDLLDQLVSRALVVTLRVAPLDHVAIEELKRGEYKRGLREGRELARADARREIAAKIAAVL